MRFKRLRHSIALSLALTMAAGTAAGAAMLPRLEADSLGGTHVVLPADASGKPLLILLGFTPESQADLKAWSRAFIARPGMTMFVVVVADRTMFASRKHIRGMVEGAAVGTRAQIDSNVLVTFDGTGWKTLVPPGDKHWAGVVVCDGSGAIAYAQRVSFSPAHVADVEHAL